jgi:anti-sigma regulatory factor (Ser/Thr protein kinase)
MTSDWSHTESWTGEAADVADARRFVAAHLSGDRLVSLMADACLVAGELVTNAVVHTDGSFTLTLASRMDSVLLTVRDESPTMFSTVLRTGFPPGSEDRGRGLMIVATLATEWGVTAETHGGKAVWALMSPLGRADLPEAARRSGSKVLPHRRPSAASTHRPPAKSRRSSGGRGSLGPVLLELQTSKPFGRKRCQYVLRAGQADVLDDRRGSSIDDPDGIGLVDAGNATDTHGHEMGMGTHGHENDTRCAGLTISR